MFGSGFITVKAWKIIEEEQICGPVLGCNLPAKIKM